MKTINDYAELVKEKHALNKTIAPVETDLTDASRGYHIGEQFIYDGEIYKAKTEIAQHDALVLNTNYEPADNLTEQIKNAGGGTGTDPRLDVFENNIAPVETDETDASRAYQVGEQLILDNILYDVIAPISEHDVITTTGSGANIEPADPISSQFQTLTNKLNNEIVTRSALGAKNILPFDLADIKALNTNGTWADNVYTYRGVAFTVNSDGTISATGTATGGNASIKIFAASSNYEMLGKEVILNGCPSGGGASTYRIQAYRMATADGSTGTYFDDGEGTDAFTALNDASGTVGSFAVAVYENETVTNLLFKPMVRLASDPDDTYQPYAKTNQELTAENQNLAQNINDVQNNIYQYEDILGIKNLLPDNLSSQVVEDVTFTVNADGSITVNGTVTPEEGETAHDIVLPICTGLSLFASNITLKNSGSYTGSDYIFSQGDNGQNGAYLTYVASTGTVNINVEVGTTVNNKTLYPMIRLKNTDTTYVPYAMTNRELTSKLGYQVEKSQITNPNILVNPWFTINQRGWVDSTNHSANAEITVDRWYIYGFNNSQTAEQNADKSISIVRENATGTGGNRYLFEDNLEYGTYTLSALVRCDKAAQTSSANRFVLSFKYQQTTFVSDKICQLITDGNYHLYSLSLDLSAPCDEVSLRFYTAHKANITIKAMKLEKGNISTLLMDTIPNYTSELLKCQRYFHKYFTQNLQPSNMYDCIPEMRVNPTQSTITIDGVTYYINDAEISI